MGLIIALPNFLYNDTVTRTKEQPSSSLKLWEGSALCPQKQQLMHRSWQIQFWVDKTTLGWLGTVVSTPVKYDPPIWHTKGWEVNVFHLSKFSLGEGQVNVKKLSYKPCKVTI